MATGAKSTKSGKKPPLKKRLNPADTEKGGRVGDATDVLLSKLGFIGKSASKLSLGSRAVNRLLPDAVSRLLPDAVSNGEGPHGPPVSIQESVDVAVPLGVVFSLATRFEDYPEFSERILDAEEVDEEHVAFDTKLRGGSRE